jgi:hypothetical protein
VPPFDVSCGRLYRKYSIDWLDYQYQCNKERDMILSLLPEGASIVIHLAIRLIANSHRYFIYSKFFYVDILFALY